MNKFDHERIKERLYSKRLIDSNGCWIWTGSKSTSGYGRMKIGYLDEQVTRVSMMIHSGFELYSPLLVLHKNFMCKSRACFNPEHLYIGDSSDNTFDAFELGTRKPVDMKGKNGNLAKTHCPQGHPYNEENTKFYRGKRYCKKCRSLVYK